MGPKRRTVKRGKEKLTVQHFFVDEAGDSTLFDNAIFGDVLHSAEENRILFSRRGKSDRTEALTKTIKQAKQAFYKKHGERPDSPTQINSASPSDSAGLQVIDYYLWAVQRLFERGDDRYYKPLARQYRLIKDLDDTLNPDYKQEIASGPEAKLAYAALLIGKEAIAFDDKSGVADEQLEKLLSYHFRLKNRMSDQGLVPGLKTVKPKRKAKRTIRQIV